jgi:hypothetical protein
LEEHDYLLHSDERMMFAEAYADYKSKPPVYCTNAKCRDRINFILKGKPSRRYECKACKEKVCGKCKLGDHGREACKGDKEVREMLAVAAESRWRKRHELGVKWGFFEAE